MSTKKAAKKTAPKHNKTANAPKAAPAKKAKTAGNGKPKKLSALNAAEKLLADGKEPMNTREMIEAMTAKGLWISPGGATPHATLFSAILREINAKWKDARFKKTDRGHFAFNG